MTPDEARGLLADSEQPPIVKWWSGPDKKGGWRFARLVSVGAKWAHVETGGHYMPVRKDRIKVEVLQHYVGRRSNKRNQP
jgi:hypothetical protein